jgi:cytosine/creatinine deaminase
LEAPFDEWSESICRGDWLTRDPQRPPLQPGMSADLIVFTAADAFGWPTRSQARVVLRAGLVAAGSVPSCWASAVENAL